MKMTNQLKVRLEGLKKKYEAVMDAINILKADGDLAKLRNLRDIFDETFDSFFDDEAIAKKYGDWDGEEERRLCDKSNGDIEEELDEQNLSELVKFYENYIGELTDEFVDLGGDSRYLDTQFGTLKFRGTEYTLTQQAYVSNYGTNGVVRYYASAVDITGKEYEVTWETTLEYDEAQELCTLENNSFLTEEDEERMQELIEKGVHSAYFEDESNACDWDDPASVKEI